MPFSSLVGNEQVARLLTRLASHLPLQALLFVGPKGVGKGAFAEAFASVLLQSEGKKEHPDCRWIRPEGKSQQHPVATIREMREDALVSPFLANKKVYILEDAERMQAPSSNALLKLLEEPPSHAVFLLLTAHEEEVLPTLRSRCMRIPFQPIEEEILYKALQGQASSPEKARQVARLAEGSFSRALALLKEGEDPALLLFFEILASSFFTGPDVAFLKHLEKIEALVEKRDEAVRGRFWVECVSSFLYWARDLHLLQGGQDPRLLFHHVHLSSLQERSQEKLPPLENVLALADEALVALQRYMRPSLVIERLFYRTALLRSNL